jgi:hypothetical protein
MVERPESNEELDNLLFSMSPYYWTKLIKAQRDNSVVGFMRQNFSNAVCLWTDAELSNYFKMRTGTRRSYEGTGRI